MNCSYCDKIFATDSQYRPRKAEYDLGSAAPRCRIHWRYRCGVCGNPSHFMATGFCQESSRFFCANCSDDREEIPEPFWAWQYFYSYRSPWTGGMVPSLDRLEYEGHHPAMISETTQKAAEAISSEPQLVRYPVRTVQWRPNKPMTDTEVRDNWNTNAQRWSDAYDDDGDRNRRYQSDEPMLELLGTVKGLNVLDVGSGNGYLCRKLARAGASVTGVELSDEFFRIATERESVERLGIVFHNASASEMEFLPEEEFDKAVSNYVLMDIADYEAALRNVHRTLKPGGTFVVVISHPCFASGHAGWETPAPDSPRTEERFAWRSDLYFHRGPYLGQWGNFDPVLSFHRTLKDYWQAFSEAGFSVTGFDEPSITERGRRELPVSRVMQALRVPYSCIFRLVKTD